jgi:hypothetical protein
MAIVQDTYADTGQQDIDESSQGHNFVTEMLEIQDRVTSPPGGSDPYLVLAGAARSAAARPASDTRPGPALAGGGVRKIVSQITQALVGRCRIVAT